MLLWNGKDYFQKNKPNCKKTYYTFCAKGYILRLPQKNKREGDFMKKRIISAVLACTLLAVTFAGCSGKSGGGDASDKVTLSISFWEAGTNRELETSLKQITDEYTALHPNVSFKLMSQPVSGYSDWLKARFASNEAPDIIENQTGELSDQFKQGLLLNISEDFNAPNPYADNKVWKDMFMPGRLEAAHEYKHEPTYAVPFMGLGLAYFYNKDIYEQLGLKEPKTWEEFLNNCRVSQENGYNPIAMMGMKGDAVMWLSWWLTTGMYANKYLADKNINVNGDGVIESKEIARAIDLGYFDITKGEARADYEKFLDMIEQLGKYSQGATGLDEAGAKAQYLAGKAVHVMSGSWDLKGFSENQTFRSGAFALPRFTKNDSEYAGDNFAISTVQVFGVTKSAGESDAKRKAAVDFMKFFTSPKQYQTFVNTAFAIPVIDGLDIDSSFDAFTTGTYPALNLFTKKGSTSKTNFSTATSLALSDDKYDRDKLISEIDKSLKEFVEDVKAKENVSREDDFGVADLPKQGEFKPTEAYSD